MPVYQDGLQRWLARFVANRGVSLALVAAVVIVDFTIPWQGISIVPRTMVDESCAVATALVLLGALTRFRSAPPDRKCADASCHHRYSVGMFPRECCRSSEHAATPNIDTETSTRMDRRILPKGA